MVKLLVLATLYNKLVWCVSISSVVLEPPGVTLSGRFGTVSEGRPRIGSSCIRSLRSPRFSEDCSCTEKPDGLWDLASTALEERSLRLGWSSAHPLIEVFPTFQTGFVTEGLPKHQCHPLNRWACIAGIRNVLRNSADTIQVSCGRQDWNTSW